jgi:hypothetical protein
MWCIFTFRTILVISAVKPTPAGCCVDSNHNQPVQLCTTILTHLPTNSFVFIQTAYRRWNVITTDTQSAATCFGTVWVPSSESPYKSHFGTHLAFAGTLDRRWPLTQTEPVLPLSNEHDSQTKDQRRRQCCHNKHKKFSLTTYTWCIFTFRTRFLYKDNWVLIELQNAVGIEVLTAMIVAFNFIWFVCLCRGHAIPDVR